MKSFGGDFLCKNSAPTDDIPDVVLDLDWRIELMDIPIGQGSSFHPLDFPGSEQARFIVIHASKISALDLGHEVDGDAADFADQGFDLPAIVFFDVDDLSHTACVVLHELEFSRMLGIQGHDDLMESVHLCARDPMMKGSVPTMRTDSPALAGWLA